MTSKLELALFTCCLLIALGFLYALKTGEISEGLPAATTPSTVKSEPPAPTTPSQPVTTVPTRQECEVTSASIEPACTGVFGRCCSEDNIVVTARYVGDCPETAILQVDADAPFCLIYDSQPEGGAEGCDGRASIEGITVTAYCEGGQCSGTFTLPANKGRAVAKHACWRRIVTTSNATLFDKRQWCEGGEMLAATGSVTGFIHLGNVDDCSIRKATQPTGLTIDILPF